VADEREAVSTKRSAYEAFLKRVRTVTPDARRAVAGAGATQAAAGTTTHAASPDRDGGRAAIREAFAATVGEVEDVADGSTAAGLAGELGEAVAVALAPTTGSALTPAVKTQVAEAADDRRFQLHAMAQACERELTALEDAAETFEAVRDRLAAVAETPPRALGFDDLRTRHERLGDALERCESLARDRQAFLDGSTASHARAGLAHRELVSFLYADLPVDHPVLDGVGTAVSACRRHRRNVRAHLTRCA
jgi:hypothetical protein